jgi:hypothetical protein
VRAPLPGEQIQQNEILLLCSSAFFTGCDVGQPLGTLLQQCALACFSAMLRPNLESIPIWILLEFIA